MTSIPGIVLAAGASVRMGRPKAFLAMTPGGTILGRVLGTLADAGVEPLVVVAREPFTPREAWNDPRADEVRVVVNPDPDRGQLSSLVCGIQAVDPAEPGRADDARGHPARAHGDCHVSAPRVGARSRRRSFVRCMTDATGIP